MAVTGWASSRARLARRSAASRLRVCCWPAIAAVNAARRWVAVGRYVGGSIDTLTLCLTAIVFSFVIGELLKPVCVANQARKCARAIAPSRCVSVRSGPRVREKESRVDVRLGDRFESRLLGTGSD